MEKAFNIVKSSMQKYDCCPKSCYTLDKDDTQIKINCIDRKTLSSCEKMCTLFTGLTWDLIKNQIDYAVIDDFNIIIKDTTSYNESELKKLIIKQKIDTISNKYKDFYNCNCCIFDKNNLEIKFSDAKKCKQYDNLVSETISTLYMHDINFEKNQNRLKIHL